MVKGKIKDYFVGKELKNKYNLLINDFIINNVSEKKYKQFPEGMKLTKMWRI